MNRQIPFDIQGRREKPHKVPRPSIGSLPGATLTRQRVRA